MGKVASVGRLLLGSESFPKTYFWKSKNHKREIGANSVYCYHNGKYLPNTLAKMNEIYLI
jgi:hypothetical protein